MNRPTHHRAAGFTLVEVIAALLVVGVSLASIAPLVVTMTGTSRETVARGEARAGLHHAIDRIARFLREIPESSSGGASAIASLTPTSITLESGAAISLDDATLSLTNDAGETHPLCDGLAAFSLTFLAADGVTVPTDPGEVQRVHVAIERDGLRLATVAFLRISEVGE